LREPETQCAAELVAGDIGKRDIEDRDVGGELLKSSTMRTRMWSLSVPARSLAEISLCVYVVLRNVSQTRDVSGSE
jgi:hypothetical protein